MPPPPVGRWAAGGAVRRLTGAKHDGSERWLNPFRPDTGWGRLRPDVLRRARAGYYGHMTHIDHQLNRLIETLGETGHAGNTVVCFTSDHGELLGDHDLFRKSLPYEGSARVPLILSGPSGTGIRSNAVVSEPVELRDVMPTLLECAGLPVPASVEGKSLLPLARGEKPRWREYLHGEHGAYGQSVQWLTDGRMKYIWWSGTGAEQLFDLRRDPAELHDLGRSARAETARWRARLVCELSGRPEEFAKARRLVTGRPLFSTLPPRFKGGAR
jgi:arylsulfatase A-like enzyme